jgi:hypothetical protein
VISTPCATMPGKGRQWAGAHASAGLRRRAQYAQWKSPCSFQQGCRFTQQSLQPRPTSPASSSGWLSTGQPDVKDGDFDTLLTATTPHGQKVTKHGALPSRLWCASCVTQIGATPQRRQVKHQSCLAQAAEQLLRTDSKWRGSAPLEVLARLLPLPPCAYAAGART